MSFERIAILKAINVKRKVDKRSIYDDIRSTYI